MHPAFGIGTTDSAMNSPRRDLASREANFGDRSEVRQRSPCHVGRRPCSNLEQANNFTRDEMEKDGEMLGGHSHFPMHETSCSEDPNLHLPSTSTSKSAWDDRNSGEEAPSPTRRRHFFRSKSVSFIPTNPKWRTRFKRRRQELSLASVPLTSKEIRSSLLASAAPTSAAHTSGDFGHELQEVQKKNTELSASLSDVQAELEALKLSIQVEKDGEVEYVPGTITGAVQDLYKAQKEWQTTMMSRLQLNETLQEENLRKIAVRLGGAAGVSSMDDVSVLTAEKNAALSTLAVTKEKLDKLRICYSLQKSLLTNPESPSTSGPRPIWHPLDPSPSFSGRPLTPALNVSNPCNPDDLMMDDVAALLLQPRSALDVEAKCQRLERLVAVLRRKLLTS